MARLLFTARAGGVSNAPFNSMNLALHVGDQAESVHSNRVALAAGLGLPLEKVFYMDQVHGKSVAVIDEVSDFNVTPVADALFTQRKDIALAVLVADCIPLLLQSDSAIAAVHVGRKGLLAGVVQSTLQVFSDHGVRKDEISAEIGAAICGRCYEVDQELYDEVVSIMPATATSVRSSNEKPCLDLPSGLTALLQTEGIKVTSTGKCTFHDEGFFSYRKDRITGRQAGVITLDKA